MTKYFKIIALILFAASAATAQIAPPTVSGARPIGAGAGESTEIEVKGGGLEGLSAVVVEGEGIAVERVEGTKAKIVVAKDATPGPRRFRVVSPKGLSNAGMVYVGRPLKGVREAEPNDGFAKAQAVELPAAIDGEIKPGHDVDVFAVTLQRGATLVAEAIAARAGSDLDALVTILDADGRPLAEADDTPGLGRDAAAVLTAPRDGRYFVQIQDANGPHRDGATENRLVRPYRLELGRLPLVTAAFPLGGRRGESITLHLLGANLDRSEHAVSLDPSADFALHLATPLGPANPWPLIVDDLPATAEAEPNDDVDEAATVAVPAAIDGRFGARGDVDVVRLVAQTGHAGDFAIRVLAARGGSPADPVVAVLDAKGATTAENDDALGRDAMVEARIDDRDGILIAVREKFGRGGGSFAYRIQIEPRETRTTITAVLGPRTVPRRGAIAIPIALQRRGPAAPWTIAAEGLPAGVAADPLTLEPGTDKGFLVLAAASDAPLGAFPLRLVARSAPEAPVILTYLETSTPPAGPRPAEVAAPMLAVAEPAPLGVSIEPAEVAIAPDATATLKVHLDRRGDASKKPVKVRLLGPVDGLALVPDATVAADAREATLTLKSRPFTSPRRVPLAVLAWFDGGPDSAGVVARATLSLREKE